MAAMYLLLHNGNKMEHSSAESGYINENKINDSWLTNTIYLMSKYMQMYNCIRAAYRIDTS